MAKNGNKRGYRDEQSSEFANEGGDESQARESNGMEEVNGGEKTDKQQNYHSGQMVREDQSSFTLQPYTNTVYETTKAIAVVQKHFEKLNEIYVKHAEDIKKVPEVHLKLFKLRNECNHKDEKIRRQKNTIAELRAMSQEEEVKLAEMRQKIKEGEKDLKERMDEQGRRAAKELKSIEALKTQMELEMKKVLDDQLLEQENEHRTRMKQLEEDMSAREDQRKRRLSSLEAEKLKLSEDLEQNKKRMNKLEEQLNLVNEDLDDNKTAKIAYKRQKEELEVTLKEVQNEFGLTSQTPDFYKERFADIAKAVEDISFEYFKALPPEDYEKIHKELKAIDICFNSIPISDEETSENLRIAHVQRIISSTLYNNIWRPFSSDKALSHPEFANLLDEMCTRLAKNDLGGKNGRAAIVWKVLSMRGLQALGQELPPSPTSTSHETSRCSSRASQAVQDMLKKLSPLVGPIQKVQIEEALLRLAQSAVDVWNLAQTDELKIAARFSLSISDRNRWGSVRFDHDSSAEAAPVETDMKSYTRPRVFTLFPQFVVQNLSTIAEPFPHIPGSFSTPQQGFSRAETSIHSGIGLSESSELVIRGKAETEENEARLSELIEKFEKEKKEVARSGRKRFGSRSGSVSGSLSGSIPNSPSARWSKGATVMAMKDED